MAKKSDKGLTTHVPRNVGELRAVHDELMARGFMPLSPEVMDISTKVESSEVRVVGSATSANLGARLVGENPITRGGRHLMFDSSETQAVAVPGKGTEGLGFIPWGPGNMLPVDIEQRAAALPYPSAALKYQIDLACGLGPKFMYRYARVVNGTVKTERIPYEDAGLLLEAEGRTDELAAWRRTVKEVRRFTQENNLELLLQKCMYDDLHMDIYFPLVGLSQGRPGKPWNPKIVALDFIPAACARFEQMDEHRRINYMYRSEAWRRNGVTAALGDNDIKAIRCIMPEHRLKEFRRFAKANRDTPHTERNCWFCTPVYEPSMLKNYYPQPAWWSIFASSVYDYAATLVYDKHQSRKNATMWGKIMYINMNYMKTLYAQSNAKTDEDRKKIRSAIYEKVNTFLQQRENNGKLMILDSWNEGDKLLKSVELVDVTETTQAAANASKTELDEIARIIFFALGVDPRLVGCDLHSGSNGGTFQRELHLLKQQQMAPRQRNFLDLLNFVARFNQWDDHCEAVIQQQVLTTLDRSKTGTEETTAQQ